MKTYLDFVNEQANSVREAKQIKLGGVSPLVRPEIKPDAPNVLFFAPHPDDESIAGGLALRLLREAKWNVVNVAVTQGSNKERQAPRLAELKDACNYIGFGLEQTAPNGLEKVTPATRANDQKVWNSMVQVINALLMRYQPKVIFFPHDADWNATHIGTHFLVMDALKTMPKTFETYCAETEFWRVNDQPNLHVEYGAEDVAALVTATSFHVGEVERNPYHLSLPAWLMDNVRRGAEIVGGQGGAAPDFVFGQLFRVRKWKDGALHETFDGGRVLSRHDNPTILFP